MLLPICYNVYHILIMLWKTWCLISLLGSTNRWWHNLVSGTDDNAALSNPQHFAAW